MGRAEDAPGQTVALGLGEIGPQAVPERLAEFPHPGFELVVDPGGQLAVMGGVGLDLVKNRRLDIRDDEPVQIVEQAPLDDLQAKGQTLGLGQGLAVKLVKHPGHRHLVGLLVHLHEFHAPVLVIPPLHERAGKKKLQQTLANTDHTRSRGYAVHRLRSPWSGKPQPACGNRRKGVDIRAGGSYTIRLSSNSEEPS